MTTIISKLRDLHGRATQGPWQLYCRERYGHDTPDILTEHGGKLFDSTHHGNMYEDSELIALLRNTLPLFLELFEAAQDRLDDGHDQLCITMQPYRECICGHKDLEAKLEALRKEVT